MCQPTRGGGRCVSIIRNQPRQAPARLARALASILAAATLDRAALFHRLKRIGKRPAAHLPPRRPNLLGELGERKSAVSAQDFGNGAADGLLRLCPWSCPRRRRGVERLEFALGNAKIGDPRLQFRNFRADAIDRSFHGSLLTLRSTGCHLAFYPTETANQR